VAPSPRGETALFYISKILWSAAQPTMLLLILTVAGAVLLGTRWQRTARGLIITAAAILVVGGILPLSTWLILPLEQRFPRTDVNGRTVAGIVILGGAEDARIAAARGTHALNMSGERMTEGIALARRYPDAKVVFTGGSTQILLAPAFETDAAGRMLADLGIGGDRVMLEGKARNTAENAVYAKALADPKPGELWLLVTSAWHMPRAMGLFRKAGFDVEPWPVDFRTAGPGDAWMLFDNPGEGLRRLDTVLREWIGLVVNRLSGRSDALLPAP
jgi:uncharacterized SAM-binding protein YcdF (DUF218 family)